MSSPATATATGTPTPHPSPAPGSSALTPEDYRAEHDLYTLLIRDTQLMGRHGATPYRRAAAPRIELQLLALQSLLTPHLGG